ncbi:MAG: hypothetical protein KatS3mg105_0270 [Gemmatales bacterium]|nr:MAG: hypothetical protein KatS3mg105_0270 [Gemmatales bacterium]
MSSAATQEVSSPSAITSWCRKTRNTLAVSKIRLRPRFHGQRCTICHSSGRRKHRQLVSSPCQIAYTTKATRSEALTAAASRTALPARKQNASVASSHGKKAATMTATLSDSPECRMSRSSKPRRSVTFEIDDNKNTVPKRNRQRDAAANRQDKTLIRR